MHADHAAVEIGLIAGGNFARTPSKSAGNFGVEKVDNWLILGVFSNSEDSNFTQQLNS